MTVNLIAAIGERGQIGLDGRLPWRRPEDLYFFRRQTEGGVVVMGHRAALPFGGDGWVAGGRFVSVPASRAPFWSPEEHLRHLAQSHPGRTIWIAGGAATYRAFAPHVDGLRLISQIDYDSNPALDGRHTFFPFDAYGIDWRAS